MVDVILERSDLPEAVRVLTERGNNRKKIAEILAISLPQVDYYRRKLKETQEKARVDLSGDPVNRLLMRRWGK